MNWCVYELVYIYESWDVAHNSSDTEQDLLGTSHPVDPRLNLGRRVKELRAERGMTQEDLAERSGLFRTYTSRIESGQATPTLTMLHQIAQAFQIDITELLTMPRGPQPKRGMSASRTSRGRAGR